MKSFRSICAGAISAVTTAAGGTIGTLVAATKIKSICTSIATAITSLTSTASNAANIASPITTSVTTAGSNAAATLSQANATLAGISSTLASSTAKITSTLGALSNAYAHLQTGVQHILEQLGNATLEVPLEIHANVDMRIPNPARPPLFPALPDTIVNFAVNQNATVTTPVGQILLSNGVSESVQNLFSSGNVTSITQELNQALGGAVTQISESSAQLGSSLQQFGQHINGTTQAVSQASGFFNTLGSQVSQLEGLSAGLPEFCSGTTLFIGLSITLLAAGLIGLTVYLCCKNCEEKSENENDFDRSQSSQDSLLTS